MTKPSSWSFLGLSQGDKSSAINAQRSTGPAGTALLKRWHFSTAVLLGTMLLGYSAPLMGQAVNATLLRTATDSSGAAVASVKVTITETNTGLSRTSQTNDSGNYTFSDLPPGTYTVTAEQPGFKRASRAGFEVIVNTTSRLDLTLQPGEVSETVNVTAEAPALKTERADTGRQIDTRAIADLPIMAGNHNFQ